MAYSTPFRTRSEIIPCKNLDPETVALCALDIGYSAVKGYSATKRFCIPSYVLEYSKETIGAPNDTDIRYKDESGVVYAVGSLALASLSSKDTNDATNTMFGRNRYFSPSFLILARVGLAIGLGNQESRPVCLQTGLPPAYRKADTKLLKEALSGHHHFWLRIGASEWEEYSFDVAPDAIFVMDQPIGSVYSATKRNDGTTVMCDNGKTYIDHRIMVLDGGFGTLDIFSISNRSIDNTNTFNNLGMCAIFEATVQDIQEMYGKEIYVHTLQKHLEEGTISVYDRATRSTSSKNISPLLQKNTRLICEKAMTKIEAAYDNLEDFDYLLVTGGTGAAWLDILRERYKGMQTLSVIAGNQNEKISPVYNNVRGYYIFRALACSK